MAELARDTDYQELINLAVKRNQPALAAYYERLRNKKIAAGYGGNEGFTYTYQSAYTTDENGKPSGAWAAGVPDETIFLDTDKKMDPNKDYQDIINKALKANQPAVAAYYERMRNQKIAAGFGGGEKATYKYQKSGNSGGVGTSYGSDPTDSDDIIDESVELAKKEFLKQQLELKKKAFEEKYNKVLEENGKIKNAAAGQSALANQGFNEQAAASGLSSGAFQQKNDASGRVLQSYMDTQDKVAGDTIIDLKKQYDDEVNELNIKYAPKIRINRTKA